MKMMLMIVDPAGRETVEEILNSAEVSGYSEIPSVFGKGQLGPKMGTRAFPGSSTLLFAAVPAEKCSELLEELRTRVDASLGLKVFSIDTVEEL